jgi:hypothetical protein
MIVVKGDNHVILANMSSKLLSLNLEQGSFKESSDVGLVKAVTLLYLNKYQKFVIGDWKSHKLMVLKLKNSIA